MKDAFSSGNQIQYVTNFQDLVTTSFKGVMNAICWGRKLQGDFAEIVDKIQLNENIVSIEPEELHALKLSEQGERARDILLQDWKLLQDYGASPVLNVIRYYDRDDSHAFFPTDVYSFHVDRAPIPTATFLCTYYGTASEILPNAQAEQKILIAEIREQLRNLFNGPEEEFEAYLSENFFDLHYQPHKNANVVKLGIGNMWRLAVDCPESNILPCIHRAPEEKHGQPRLLMIC